MNDDVNTILHTIPPQKCEPDSHRFAGDSTRDPPSLTQAEQELKV
jgi:hypothetical protein